MRWHKLSENFQAVENIYTNVPSPDNVEIFSICLNRESPKIRIVFDLPIFPDKPPVKWHKSFNTAQIELTFYDIKNFQASGWSTEIKADIDIEKVNNQLKISVTGREINLSFSFSCEFFRIDKVTAYQKTFLEVKK